MKYIQRLHCNYRVGARPSRRSSPALPRLLWTLVALPLTTTLVIANAYAAVVNYTDVVQQGVDVTAGLAGATTIAADPDGTRLYIAATADSALTVLNRDGSGALSLREVQLDTSVGGQVDGLSGVSGLAVGADGGHVYTVAPNDHALAVFERTMQGLHQIEIYRDGTAGVTGLRFPFKVAASADGAHVYVTTRDPAGTDSVFAFTVLDAAGRLGFLARYEEGVGGISGIADATGLIVSADGRQVYVSSGHDDAVAVFARNDDPGDAGFGRLTWVAGYRDGLNDVDGIAGAGALALDPAGMHLYAAGTGENAIAAFARDGVTGELDFIAVYRNGANGITGLGGPLNLVVSPDGGRLYVAGTAEHALVVLRRDPSSGLLSQLETHRNGDGGDIDGLDRVLALAVSPDGAHLYTASPLAAEIGVFALATANLQLVVTGDPAGYRLIITNHGPDSAGNIRLTDQMPAGATAVHIDPPAGATCTQAAQTVACELDALTSGAMAEFGLSFDPAQAGAVINTGSVYADQRDPDVSNNTDGAEADINSPPVAVADEAMTTPNTAITIAVLTNDSDPDGDTLVVEANDAASQHDGAITRNSDGTLAYTPAAGFTGNDTFGYTVSDGQDTAMATVSVTVQATGSGVSVGDPDDEETQGSRGGGGGMDPLFYLALLPWIRTRRHPRPLLRARNGLAGTLSGRQIPSGAQRA